MIISCLLLSLNMQAQDDAAIIHVETAGTLPTLIAANKKFQITNLTLTGNLNGTDIAYIRDMAGRTFDDKQTDGKLSVLNLSDANIVSGGNVYYVEYYVVGNGYNGQNRYYTSAGKIGDYAFYRCTSLTSVSLPNSVYSIGEWAFSGCTSLTNVTIGNSVYSIGDYAFSACRNLTSVTIGNNAFGGCANLTSIDIPDRVYSIGKSAFNGCIGLTNAMIPNSVYSIGESAFAGCTNLTIVTIGNNVASIGESAFRGCVELRDIVVSGDNTAFSVIDSVLFNEDETLLIFYLGKSSVYTIPNSVTSIGAGAFSGCVGLTSITIPESVATIGD